MVLLALLSPPFSSPTDTGHGADDRDNRQVRPRDPTVTGAGVPPVPRRAAGSSERLLGARGLPGPLGSGTVGSLPGIGAVGGHQHPLARGMPKHGVTLVSPPSAARIGPMLSWSPCSSPPSWPSLSPSSASRPRQGGGCDLPCLGGGVRRRELGGGDTPSSPMTYEFPHWQVDFTSCPGLFCVLGIVVMVTGIVTAIVLSFKYVSGGDDRGAVGCGCPQDWYG